MSRDFGKHKTTHDGVVLECKYVAPGLTFQDIVNTFYEAEKDHQPMDDFSANPSKWKNHRGLSAVVKLIVEAFDEDDSNG